MTKPTIDYDGTDFNDFDFTKTNVVTTQNFDVPITPFGGADGGIFPYTSLASMNVNVSGVAPPASDDDIRAALASREFKELQVTGFASRYWLAKLAGSINCERTFGMFMYDLSFITDGAAYASSETVTPIPDNSDTPVPNTGSSQSYPVIVVSGLGAASVVTIENKTTGQTCVFDNDGLSFSAVTVDCTPGSSTVYEGSTSGMTGVSDSSWVPMYLAVGTNTFNITTTAGSTPSATITFKKRYI